MRVLVVHAHPNPESLNRALCDAAVGALRRGGHEVRVLDLYAMGFDPVMSREERAGYHTPGDNEVPVAEHLAHLRWCEALVFVYPTWWFGLPAMLKGWLDRVLVPHVAFTMPTRDTPIRPLLTNITRVTAITTAGASWLFSAFVGEPGRRTLLRGVRTTCAPRCRTRYLVLRKIDSRTAAERAAFLKRVDAAMVDP